MGKNFAGRLNRLLTVAVQAAKRLDNEAVAAAEARLKPVNARRRANFFAWLQARHAGLPEPEYVHVPYDGEQEDRELVSRYYAQFHPPGYDARAELMRRIDLIRERQQAAEGLEFPFKTIAEDVAGDWTRH